MTTEWIITRDGRPTYGRYATEDAAFGELLRRVPYSVDHATTHEGYAFLEVPADRWSDVEAKQLRVHAVRVLNDHGHTWSFTSKEDRELTRENCGACALAGAGAFRQAGLPTINYAGWERIYTQAGRPVGPRFRAAFRRELETTEPENERYHAALLLDVATFGNPAE